MATLVLEARKQNVNDVKRNHVLLPDAESKRLGEILAIARGANDRKAINDMAVSIHGMVEAYVETNPKVTHYYLSKPKRLQQALAKVNAAAKRPLKVLK